MTSLVNRGGWLVAAVLGLLVVAALAGLVHGGSLDPPGTPGPTRPQVEPRSPIPPVGWNGTFPIVISQPGSYFLTQDLSGVASTDGIQIAVSDVTLDLNGFSLIGNNGGKGVDVTVSATNIAIRNGAIRSNWGTGIYAPNADASVAEDLRVANNTNGILLGAGAIVRNVQAESNTGGAIQLDDNHNLYTGGLVEDSTISGNVFGLTLFANNVRVRGNVIDSNQQGAMTINGSFDVVTDNTIQGSNSGFCVSVYGTVDTIARNVVDNCPSGWLYDFTGVTNHIGPATSDLTSSQPWSNAAY